MALVLYFSVLLVLLPIWVTGYVLFIGKALIVGLTSGVSTTALGPMTSRYTFDRLGSRPDPACRAIFLEQKNVSALGIKMLLGSIELATKLSGHVPPFARYPLDTCRRIEDSMGLRTTFFDRALAEHLDTVEQFVVLGAGFDTRCYSLPDHVAAFEVDTSTTQPIKRRALERGGVNTERVTFVSVNFNDPDWWTSLTDAGLDQSKPTFFLWEGVTYYLHESSVRGLLTRVSSTMAPGSLIAFDYFSHEFVRGTDSWAQRVAVLMLALIREPFYYGIETGEPARSHAANLVESCALELIGHNLYGRKDGRRKPIGGTCLARVSKQDSSLSEAT